ncbi:hypothetical protein FHX51_000745 [Aeriscardovia aeriphila]|uniref:Uncharacterized protein n=1 Tax=Aeriscardovia aeriphila TaxID=218139 RepID=A0A261FAQ7_9BIFI|nr:hypothetical protein [Aeriscardovia aeriphila]OZG56053.1 hypothetical protein AEAE_0541 [Aeriscardovia aeriphila]
MPEVALGGRLEGIPPYVYFFRGLLLYRAVFLCLCVVFCVFVVVPIRVCVCF